MTLSGLAHRRDPPLKRGTGLGPLPAAYASGQKHHPSPSGRSPRTRAQAHPPRVRRFDEQFVTDSRGISAIHPGKYP
jgi:hypothetical protein